MNIQVGHTLVRLQLDHGAPSTELPDLHQLVRLLSPGTGLPPQHSCIRLTATLLLDLSRRVLLFLTGQSEESLLQEVDGHLELVVLLFWLDSVGSSHVERDPASSPGERLQVC